MVCLCTQLRFIARRIGYKASSAALGVVVAASVMTTPALANGSKPGVPARLDPEIMPVSYTHLTLPTKRIV